jgi:short-subunit dehydrogenase
VNNAGASRFGSLTALSPDEVRRLIQLDLVTPALLSQAFLRSAAPGATLVNVTSIVGTIGVPGNATYSAAKAGLQTLTECLWAEAERRGVRVLDFRPVSLGTGFHQAAGGGSLAAPGMQVASERAARDLVQAIEGRWSFVYAYGRGARVLELMRRLLPKRWLVRLMARRSRRAGYL